MGLVLAVVWLFLFLVVFGWFSIVSILAVVFSFSYGNKILSLLLIPLSTFLSWKLTSYLLNILTESLQNSEVNQLFAFSIISWREEMLYLFIATTVVGVASFMTKKHSKAAFSCLMALVMVFAFSGTTQAYISLFHGNEFLKSNGVDLSY